MDRPAQVGSRVRYCGPTLFASGSGWVGVIVRMPVHDPGPDDKYPTRALVQVGVERRPRPVHVSSLQVLRG